MNSVVLLVDDDPTIRLLAAEALSGVELAVVEAEDGNAALSLFDRHQPDLVISDVQMPHTDGHVLCRTLRLIPHGADVPILMMTGSETPEAIDAAFAAGATDFIAKPLNYPILVRRAQLLLRSRQALAALHRSRLHLDRAQRIGKLAYWEWSVDSGDLYLSDILWEWLGNEPKPLLAGDEAALVNQLGQFIAPYHRELAALRLADALRRRSRFEFRHDALLDEQPSRTIDHVGEVLVNPLTKQTRICGLLHDVTDQLERESTIFRLANNDPLTGLPNRNYLKDHLEHYLATARRQNRSLAMAALNLDHFQRINDSLGYTAGNALIRQVADRLCEAVRRSDWVLRIEQQLAPESRGPAIDHLAHLGGDAFVVLLTELERDQDAAVAIQRMQEALRQPFVVGGQQIVLTASMGISLFPADAQDVETLFEHSDTALHHAKQQGRDRYQYYAESMNAQARERLALEAGLTIALEQRQFQVHYQPKVDTQTGRTVGMEALIRWLKPETGMVPPNAFIPIAERCGLIVPIGEWILATACHQSQAWQQTTQRDLKVAVNLSVRQFRDPGLLDAIERALGESGLHPASLELEITESILMEDAARTQEILRALKQLGVSIALDDFGTGYSSLSYLTRFPIDTLKIDRSFILHLNHDTRSAAIVEGIIQLSHSLGLHVVAEGVENEAERQFLAERNCNAIQGYLFSPPLPADGFTSWLDEENRRCGRQETSKRDGDP